MSLEPWLTKQKSPKRHPMPRLVPWMMMHVIVPASGYQSSRTGVIQALRNAIFFGGEKLVGWVRFKGRFICILSLFKPVWRHCAFTQLLFPKNPARTQSQCCKSYALNHFIEAELLLRFAVSIWKMRIVASESWQQGMHAFLGTATAGLQAAESRLQNWNLQNTHILYADYTHTHTCTGQHPNPIIRDESD